jgi:hypothetical protein
MLLKYNLYSQQVKLFSADDVHDGRRAFLCVDATDSGVDARQVRRAFLCGGVGQVFTDQIPKKSISNLIQTTPKSL